MLRFAPVQLWPVQTSPSGRAGIHLWQGTRLLPLNTLPFLWQVCTDPALTSFQVPVPAYIRPSSMLVFAIQFLISYLTATQPAPVLPSPCLHNGCGLSSGLCASQCSPSLSPPRPSPSLYRQPGASSACYHLHSSVDTAGFSLFTPDSSLRLSALPVFCSHCRYRVYIWFLTQDRALSPH